MKIKLNKNMELKTSFGKICRVQFGQHECMLNQESTDSSTTAWFLRPLLLMGLDNLFDPNVIKLYMRMSRIKHEID